MRSHNLWYFTQAERDEHLQRLSKERVQFSVAPVFDTTRLGGDQFGIHVIEWDLD